MYYFIDDDGRPMFVSPEPLDLSLFCHPEREALWAAIKQGDELARQALCDWYEERGIKMEEKMGGKSEALAEVLAVVGRKDVQESKIHDAVSLLAVLSREELCEVGRATGTAGLSRLSKIERINRLRAAILSAYWDGRD